MNHQHPNDLQSRILALLDGTLGEGEIRQLDAELKASREARDLFRQLSTLHSTLEEQGAARPAKGRPLIPMERVLADQRRTMFRRSIVAAAALIMVSTLVLFLKMIPQTPATLGEFRASSGAVFSVTHDQDGDSPPAHNLMEGSRLQLRKGTVEVTFVSGVRGVIEGPAHLKVLADNRVRLHGGSAWFDVPPPATGFAVETLQLVAVDLGTQFGVLATSGEADQVHVIKGSVAVTSPGATGQAKPLTLRAGEARESTPDGQFRIIEFQGDDFATTLPEAPWSLKPPPCWRRATGFSTESISVKSSCPVAVPSRSS